MKLKLTADPKKWMVFVIYCIFMLYFVAIAVLNLSYFANYGGAWGLNPFPAFVYHLDAVIVFYVFAVIFLFVAV